MVGAHIGMDGAFVIMDYAALRGLVQIENKVASLYLEEKRRHGVTRERSWP